MFGVSGSHAAFELRLKIKPALNQGTLANSILSLMNTDYKPVLARLVSRNPYSRSIVTQSFRFNYGFIRFITGLLVY